MVITSPHGNGDAVF